MNRRKEIEELRKAEAFASIQKHDAIDSKSRAEWHAAEQKAIARREDLERASMTPRQLDAAAHEASQRGDHREAAELRLKADSIRGSSNGPLIFVAAAFAVLVAVIVYLIRHGTYSPPWGG